MYVNNDTAYIASFRKLDRKLFEYVDKLDLKVGFNVKAYLDIRAKSYIENTAIRKLPDVHTKVVISDSIKYPNLFAILKKWRAAKAEKMEQPDFFVLHQKALTQIAEQLH